MRTFLLSLFFLSSIAAGAQFSTPLSFTRSIPLRGISGKFDHFAVDLAGHRLFAAATGNHSVEVIDLDTDKVAQSITGLGKPHGLAWVAPTGSLYVADGELAELRVYKGTPLALARAIKLSDDTDDLVYDAATRLIYVGHGGSDAGNPARIAVVDTTSLSLKADIPVATHPEALDMDSGSGRVFANIADSSEVAVIDRAGNSISSHWQLDKAGDNVPMAYDAGHRLLYLACRRPAVLIALDGDSGRELSRVPIGRGADDLFYDAVLHRVYVISGAGEVDSYGVDSRNALSPLPVLKTAAGAKTALFVPSQGLLYVGVPGAESDAGGAAGHGAEIRVYSTQSK
ncbi:MAG: hypothetical protein WBE76_31365 [Terracidiphilus sp.]